MAIHYKGAFSWENFYYKTPPVVIAWLIKHLNAKRTHGIIGPEELGPLKVELRKVGQKFDDETSAD